MNSTTQPQPPSIDEIKADPRFAEWMSRRIPLRRPGDHAGLEGLAVFFASPHSDYITGQCLPVDGGLCIS
mgnify:CR=1 FL=1